jgi:hypothetical protein
VFSRHLLNGSLLIQDSCSVSEIEQGLRIMAKEHRLARRGLSDAIAGALHTDAGDKAFVRSIASSENSPLFYVFAICPKNGMNQQTYSKMRRDYLSDYCYVLSWKRRQIKTVVGIAMQPLDAGSTGNFDMVVLDAPTWDEEHESTAKQLQHGWGFQSDSAIRRWEATDYEYPTEIHAANGTGPSRVMRKVNRPRSHHTGRNSQCPCGSGKKYKHCCLC